MDNHLSYKQQIKKSLWYLQQNKQKINVQISCHTTKMKNTIMLFSIYNSKKQMCCTFFRYTTHVKSVVGTTKFTIIRDKVEFENIPSCTLKVSIIVLYAQLNISYTAVLSGLQCLTNSTQFVGYASAKHLWKCH